MNYILAVFRSRYSTLNFANFLKSNNIPAAIINTPQSVSRACGISVKFPSDFFPVVQNRMLRMKVQLNNFDGFYALVQQGGRIDVRKI